MSLQNVALPYFILPDLYKDALVDIPEDKTQTTTLINSNKPTITDTQNSEIAVKPVANTPNWFLGGFQQKFFIIVNDSSAVFINEVWLSTLTKLLAALKMNLNDVAIVNIAHSMGQIEKIASLAPKTMLLFDVQPADIGQPFSMSFYQVQQFGQCTYLVSSSLALSDDKTTESIKLEKTRLWLSLKSIFVS